MFSGKESAPSDAGRSVVKHRYWPGKPFLAGSQGIRFNGFEPYRGASRASRSNSR